MQSFGIRTEKMVLGMQRSKRRKIFGKGPYRIHKQTYGSVILVDLYSAERAYACQV